MFNFKFFPLFNLEEEILGESIKAESNHQGVREKFRLSHSLYNSGLKN
jgi:hypothetical protein